MKIYKPATPKSVNNNAIAEYNNCFEITTINAEPSVIAIINPKAIVST
jgi:hypothetical protein